jgi:hypothetical protein
MVRVVCLASKIKVVDDITRASKTVGDYRYYVNILCILLLVQVW